MKPKFLRTMASVLTAAVLLAGCGGAGGAGGSGGGEKTQSGAAESAKPKYQGQTLVVTSYGGAWEEFLRKEVLPDFEKQTGAKVELAVGLSKDWMAKLRAAGKANPPYDVVIANTTHVSGARAEGNFVKLPEDKIPNLKDIHPALRNKDDIGVLGLIQPLGIAYRTDLVKNPPTSWKDLWKPEFKGKLGVYSANNSAMPMFVMMVGKVQAGDPKNIDKSFEMIKQLKPFKQSDFNGDMEKLLTRGEIEVGILDTPTVARLKKQGAKVEFVTPAEGVFMFEQDMNVTTGSKVKDLAYEFINHMLSQPIQKRWADVFYNSPSNTKVQIDAELKKSIPIGLDQMDKIQLWDWNWMNSGPKEQIIDRWNKEIAG